MNARLSLRFGLADLACFDQVLAAGSASFGPCRGRDLQQHHCPRNLARMSDSESLSDSPPSDAALKEALQNIVQEIYESRKVEDLTVKRVRIAAEKRLGLRTDFFKDHPVWKEKSKDIIQAEVVRAVNPIGQCSSS